MLTPTILMTAGRRRRAFSLAELMIAIGILAIGLVMAGALFPAAMQMNRRSSRDVIGSIICENGLAMTKVRFASGAVSPPPRGSNPGTHPKLMKLADDTSKGQEFFSKEMCRYPQGDADSEYGFVLLYRYIDRDLKDKTPEGRQLIAVSYKRRSTPNDKDENPDPWADKPVYLQGGYGSIEPDPNYLRLSKVTQSQSVGGTPDGDIYVFREGSPIFDRLTGRYGRIRSVSAAWAGSAVLDRAIDLGADDVITPPPPPLDNERAIDVKGRPSSKGDTHTAGNAGGPWEFFVLLEKGQDRYSPALTTLMTRMSLDWR
ncbi:MAG: PulJ/GspJ family protein [Planctomycetota bacterium]|jgi:prepilin-type N-terminal cleavage/methylation domain-containing protein